MKNNDIKSLSHTSRNCKYHIVFASKYRRKVFYEEKRLEIRKIIYTTNPIESLNSALRKVTRGKGSFINEIALMKVLFLRVEKLQKKWCKGTQNWRNVQNQLSIIFEERYTKYIL